MKVSQKENPMIFEQGFRDVSDVLGGFEAILQVQN